MKKASSNTRKEFYSKLRSILDSESVKLRNVITNERVYLRGTNSNKCKILVDSGIGTEQVWISIDNIAKE